MVVVEPVGGGTVPVFAHMVPFTVATGEVVLQEHQISLLNSLARHELLTRTGDVAHVFVAHDDGASPQREAVLTDVGAADTGDFHLQ